VFSSREGFKGGSVRNQVGDGRRGAREGKSFPTDWRLSPEQRFHQVDGYTTGP
jgi:hypothetical protein